MEVKNLYYRSCNVQFKVIGNGTPLILVHGYQADSRVWEPVTRSLAKKFTLIIPDLPGHGKSPLIQPINTMDFFADIINRICLSMGIEYLSIAGHSMGGYAALAFAAKYSFSIEKLTLINSHPFEDSMAQVLARNRETDLLKQGKKHLLIMPNAKNNFFEPENPEKKELIEFATTLALEQPVEGMVADLAGMMVRLNLSYVLQKARFQSDIIYGDSDTKFPLDKIYELNSEKIKRIEITNCGHFCLLEKPQEVVAALSD
jgi:pimeloyl-ACP methyl ester carboxylesterase